MRSSGGTNFEILYGERDEEELSNEGLGGGEGKNIRCKENKGVKVGGFYY